MNAKNTKTVTIDIGISSRIGAGLRDAIANDQSAAHVFTPELALQEKPACMLRGWLEA